jgi:hypothetical protein
MNSKFLVAGLTAALLLGASVGAMAADPKTLKITPAVSKQLQAAQAASNKKDYPAVLAAVEEAKKVSNRTGYDNYLIARFTMSAHIGMADLAAAAADAQAAADTDPSQIPDAEIPMVYQNALKLSLNQKQFDKVGKYAKLYQATNPTAPEDQALIGQALYLGGDFAGAEALAQKNIDAAIAAGRKPARTDLDVVMAAQVKQNNQAGAEKTLETLVANYNTPEDWNQLMGVALTSKGMRDIDYVYMGRLMLAQGGKIRPEDATLVGSAANSNKLGLYGDAEQMQKAGGPAPDPRAAADKASLPKQIADAAKQDGEYNVKTAEAAYGYGRYADAEALARAAKSKPGVKDPTEPDTVLAMSLAAQGKYAEAAPIFDSIKQSNPASARVLRLWGYYVKNKANPPAGATAAAQ